MTERVLSLRAGIGILLRGRSHMRTDARDAAVEKTASLVGLLAFVASYIATDWLALPHFYFLPLEDRWVLARRVGGCAMGYFGMWLTAAFAGMLAWAAVRVIGGALSHRRWPGPGVLTWMAGSSVVGGMLYFAWTEWC